MSLYRAVVFDLDGTLVNSLSDLAASANEVLGLYGKAPHETDEYRYFVGNGSRKLMERILPDASVDLIDEALKKYREVYARRLLETTRPYPGIPVLLSELKRRKVATAVCTNKPMAMANKIVERLFPAGTFEMCIGDRPGFSVKPDPENLLYILYLLQISPGEALFVGDSGVDMLTASNGGAVPAGALWGFRTRDELLENGAKILLSHPSELIEKLDAAS